MKKRVFSILLSLYMVLMLFTVTGFADENYMITQNFKYGTRTYDGTDPQTSPYQFVIPAGGSFGLATIEDCSPYELVGWQESVSGTVYPPYAEIQNLQSDLTFDAVYQVQGGLTITVDGFMPGNTPNDCTYTFDSTIPGVTFDEKDIKYLRWKILWAGQWEPISETEAFEAGTSYRFEISLKNNGLGLVPATTANGIAPMYRQVVSNNGVPYAINMEFELGTPVAPTLAITVDNFEVGKKLSDCTFSFETTNLDVTFSESDILGVNWEAYDRYAESFYQIDDSNVFQTGVPSYRCSIELDSKGLTVAPAVTVNGNTPESCEIVTSGGKTVLRITCELGTPLAQQLTISGMSVVCKDQDYEFSVTAAEGAEALYFLYRCGEFGGDTGWDRTDGGVCYGTVPASDYRDADTLELTVYGTAANGKPATATRTVQILKEHRFVDGVCACGAKTEYTITYDGGEGVEGSIDPETKADGVPVTLSSETFTKDGYVQTGWMDKETGAVYALGDTYTEDEDVTLYPMWEELVTLTVPFTTTVKLGGNAAPGETTFELAVVDANAGEETYADVNVSAAVTTNGEGDYEGTLTLTGPSQQLWNMLCEGAFVQQVNAGEEGWTYDDTVWGLLLSQIAAYSTADSAYDYTVLVLPATCEETEDGVYYDLDWEAMPLERMSFTNTYTKTITAPTEPTEPTESDSNTGGTNTAQTGDSRNIGLWFALLAVSTVVLVITGVHSKPRRSSRTK